MKQVPGILIKTVLFSIGFVLSLNSFSQVNGHFETWSNDNGYEEPDAWFTSNLYTINGGSISCYKSTESHWGNYALKLSPCFYPPLSRILPGFAIQINPVNKRLNSISVYYKYSNPIQDSASILLSFYKGSVDTANVIGECLVYFCSQPDWTQVKEDIKWKTNETPDTMTIFVSTGVFSQNDTLLIDDIELSEFNVDIPGKTLNQVRYSVKANSLSFFNLVSNENQLTIRNLYGDILYNGALEDNKVDLSLFPRGLYTFELRSKEYYMINKFSLY
jgi:hypothetical protein